MLLEQLTDTQWKGWLYFYELEPWGFDVDDARLGIVSATIARTMGAEGITAQDFMMGPHMASREQPEPEFDVYEQLKQLLPPKPSTTLDVTSKERGGISFEQPVPQRGPRTG